THIKHNYIYLDQTLIYYTNQTQLYLLRPNLNILHKSNFNIPKMSEKSVSSKIIKYFIILLLAYIAYNNIPFRYFFNSPSFFAYFGAILSIVFNIIGTSRGMLSISNTCAGVSVLFPRVSGKAIIGIILCETNLLCGMVLAYMLIQTDVKTVQAGHCLFTSGLVMGTVGYASSLSTGLICAAVNVTDAKEESLFPKLVFFEFLAGSIGVLGFALAFMCKEKAKNFV
ncbi:putative vacuolar ATP synthase, partial [Pseudoloma neurophilia]